MSAITLRVNGRTATVDVDPSTPLLYVLRNDLGLLAEEYDPHLKRQVGNFPQAFSHVALINTANNLTSLHGPAKQRAER